jgi:nicotinate-nucleotide adenylyltransferase
VLPEAHDLQHLLHIHQLHDQEDLTQYRAGGIWIEEITQLTISATQIRNLLATQKNPRYLLPHSVLNFIHTHQLYR